MKRLAFAAALALQPPAHAQQWFALSARDSSPSDTLVEVDLDTVHLHENRADAVIRVTHDVIEPHPAGFGYRSLVGTASIDCARRNVALESAAYFALPGGQGARVGADSTGRIGGIPPRVVERIPRHARQALLRAACPPAQ